MRPEAIPTTSNRRGARAPLRDPNIIECEDAQRCARTTFPSGAVELNALSQSHGSVPTNQPTSESWPWEQYALARASSVSVCFATWCYCLEGGVPLRCA